MTHPGQTLRAPCRRGAVAPPCALAAALALHLALCSAAAGGAETTLSADRIADGVHLLAFTQQIDQGTSRWNVLAAIAGDEALLVDASTAPTAPRVREALEDLGVTRVRYVVDTHHHADHTGGNPLFAEEAVIVSSRATRSALASGAPYGPEIETQALPRVTTAGRTTLHLGTREAELLTFADGHTAGDAVVHFPASGDGAGVAALGDLVLAAGALPYARRPEALVEIYDALLAALPEGTVLVPGHGPPMELSDLRRLREVVAASLEVAEVAAARGLGVEEARREGLVSAEWSAWDSRFLTVDSWLERLFGMARTARSPGRLAVVSRSAHEVVFVDPRDHQVTGRMAVGVGPHELAVDPSTGRLFVPSYGMYPEPHEEPIPPEALSWRQEEATGLAVIEPGLGSDGAREVARLGLDGCGRAHGVAVHPVEPVLWVTCEEIDQVWELSAEDGSVRRRWDVGDGPHIVLSAEDGDLVVASNVQGGTVSFVDRISGLVQTVPTGAGAEGLALSPDGAELWVLNNADATVSVVDVASRRVVEAFPVPGRFPVKAVFTPGGREVWMTQVASSSVAVFDAATRRLRAEIPLGTPPLGIAAGPSVRDAGHGGRIYVTTPRRNEVLVFDAQTRTVVGRIGPVMEPDGMAWVPEPALDAPSSARRGEPPGLEAAERADRPENEMGGAEPAGGEGGRFERERRGGGRDGRPAGQKEVALLALHERHDHIAALREAHAAAPPEGRWQLDLADHSALGVDPDRKARGDHHRAPPG